MPGQGEWQQVRRRKRYPSNWRCSSPQQPRTKPYLPYSSYAQVLCRNVSPSAMSTDGSTRFPSPPSSQPATPSTIPSTVYYVSPHSPSRLRFPPSPSFAEWKGRCFRCCRTGHTAATCRNPKRCGRCWSYGHIGSRCTQEVVPPPAPTTEVLSPKSLLLTEPAFDELLADSYPYRTPEMPEERPLNLHCFIERDEEYFKELNRLKNAVVMYTRNFEWDLTADNAGDYAVRTNLVSREEIQVSELSGSRFLIVLPAQLDPDTFINATSQETWDEGITFQPWSALDEASISVPVYKVLLSLTGVQPHLWRESAVAQALNRFGLYLGSVQPEHPAKLTSWMAAVAVDDLSLVPHRLTLHVGGMLYTITVHAVNWKRSPLYSATDMPKPAKVYTRPQPPVAPSSSDEDMCYDDQEPIPMSRRILRELCRGRTADTLPPELQQFASMEVIPMENPQDLLQGMATEDLSVLDQTVQPENQKVLRITQNSSDRVMIEEGHIGVAGQQAEHTPIRILRRPGKETIGNQFSEITPAQRVPHSSRLPTKNAPLHLAGQASVITNPTQGPLSGTVPQRIHLGTPARVSAVKGKRGAGRGRRQMSAGGSVAISQETGVNMSSLDPGKNKNPEEDGQRAELSGPSSSELTLRAFRKVMRKRKKTAGQLGPGPSDSGPSDSGPSPTTGPIRTGGLHENQGTQEAMQERATVDINAAGCYEVRLPKSQMEKIAAECGFQIKDIEGMVQEDNNQRNKSDHAGTSGANNGEEDMDYDLSRFELDPTDVLTSDEE